MLGLEPSGQDLQPALSQTLTEIEFEAQTKYGTKSSVEHYVDPQLAVVMSAWTLLPAAMRAGIVAMVEATCPANQSGDAGDGDNGDKIIDGASASGIAPEGGR